MKVLFIGNDASRTGAPIVLLSLLRWLRANTNLGIEVLLRVGGGALQRDFEALGPTTAYSDLISDRRLSRRIARRFGLRSLGGASVLSAVEQIYATRKIDLIYCNTISNGGILNDLARLNCPALCHVHELESAIARYGEQNLEGVRRHVHRYIAVSRAVQDNLVRRHAVPPGRIEVVHAFIPTAEVLKAAPARDRVREALGVEPGALVVGGSGFTAWRKGRDLFVQLAALVKRRGLSRTVRFLWVGGRPDPEEWLQARHDVAQAGVEDCLRFVPETPDAAEYFAACDVFAMVSREDPYPLVAIEAACLGKPVLCFANAGGAPELVEEDAGFVVPYLDTPAMAERIAQLAADGALLRRLGEQAARKVRERHDVAVAARRILAILQQVAGGAGNGPDGKENAALPDS